MIREEEERLEKEEETNFQAMLTLSPEEVVRFGMVVLSSERLHAGKEEAVILVEGSTVPQTAIPAKGSGVPLAIAGPMAYPP
ncbi:hypothetical protein ACLOJK_039210 [Asimina triloba]